MSKRRKNPWQCVGKFAFRTAAMAREVAKRMSQRKKGAVHAYHCASCAGWHVGSSSIRNTSGRRVRR